MSLTSIFPIDWNRSWRSLLIHHSSDAFFRLTLDKRFSILLFGQINPNNCARRMEIWFWSTVNNRIAQFPSPNIWVMYTRLIIDVMAVGARSERMRFVIFHMSISKMSQQKTTNNCHLSQEHSTSAKGNSFAHLWMTRFWSEFEVFSIMQDLVGPVRFYQQCRFWHCGSRRHWSLSPLSNRCLMTWAK